MQVDHENFTVIDYCTFVEYKGLVGDTLKYQTTLLLIGDVCMYQSWIRIEGGGGPCRILDLY